ncbi:hypothetical protein [Escherichia coli]|uniref:hypothetical protein n=1 Tax=Escherichia coli TaxID=562 RepID=UPI0012FF7942|nr:hypothetical protein [Escherichia coli]EFF9299875.1 hypothetical protein [Escherichia coli]EFF9337848.1 hypothetical protein [Escherichia coli]EFF9364922.1 hypothetical protein [Escherichia coli]EFF9383228.1 hypothetical protein [Escherichia coli]
MTEGNSEKKSGKQKSRVLMEKTPNRSGMFQNVSDIIREPGQGGDKKWLYPVDYLSTAVFIAISAWGVMPSVRRFVVFSGKPLRPGRMRPGWHPVKHGGILP